MAPTFVTPGVYIEEKNANAHAVAGVATAVPAFVGYTAKAEFNDTPLTRLPTRISSLSEFHEMFGEGPLNDVRFKLEKGAIIEPAAAHALQTRDATSVALGGQAYTLTQTAGFYLHACVQHFFQSGGGSCYIVSVGGYDAGEGRFIDKQTLIDGIAALESEREATMLVIPDAVLLSQADCAAVQQEALRHCGGVMRNRVAILDVREGYRARDVPPDCIDAFRASLGNERLSYGVAYYPWLNTNVFEAGDVTCANISVDSREVLIAAIKDELAAAGLAAATIEAATVEVDAINSLDNENRDEVVRLTKALTAISAFFRNAMEEIRRRSNMLPPSATMAGIYAMVDNTRGVWKAPANVSVVATPCIAISSQEQEDLNVSADGKSINAIRSFAGQGTLVWGARTLDGNSLDHRYINVRRTLIMIEESIRMALQPLVFESNDAATWTIVKHMIENFLHGIWKQGGLAGATPDDAFSVSIGLGQTMTQQDIDDGILRATILVALVRPAEFIEITLQRTMQSARAMRA